MNPYALSLSLLALYCAGCATTLPELDVSKYGELDLAWEKDLRDTYHDEQREEGRGSSEDVVVLIDQFPEGLRADGASIEVQPGYEHEILARFSLTAWRTYASRWKVPYCYGQLPLVIGTLTLWSIVPTFWPCFPQGHYCKQDLVDEATRVAERAGADLVVGSFVPHHDPERSSGILGFLIRVDPRARDEEGDLELKTSPADLGEPLSI